MLRSIILGFVFMLGGCANAPLTQSQIADVNNIAVVTLLGDEMPMTLLGSSILQIDKTDINVTKWNLRQSFKDAMIKETKKNGKAFVDINFDRAKVSKAMKSKKDTNNRLMNQKENEIQDYLLKTAAAGGAKFLWIISPSAHPYYPEQTGYGIFCRAPAGSTGEWHSYLSFHAALWDTTKELKVYQGAVNPEMMKALSGKVCSESKKFRAAVFAEQFKPALVKMLQQSATLLNEWSGLTPKTAI